MLLVNVHSGNVAAVGMRARAASPSQTQPHDKHGGNYENDPPPETIVVRPERHTRTLPLPADPRKVGVLFSHPENTEMMTPNSAVHDS
jgi:hypothetical protein